jgi:hypothetical protein
MCQLAFDDSPARARRAILNELERATQPIYCKALATEAPAKPVARGGSRIYRSFDLLPDSALFF